MDNSLIEAAHDLGASRLTIFIRIIIPYAAPGITSGIHSGLYAGSR